MLYRWFQNFAQMPLENHYSDKQMREIPSPYLEYYITNTLHTTHLGVILGSIIIPGSIKAYNRELKWRKLSRFWSKSGLFTGILCGPLLAFARIKYNNYDEKAVYKECYRARYDKKQLFVDRSFVVSFTIGYLFNGWYSLPQIVGTTTAFAFFYNQFLWQRFTRVFRFLDSVALYEKQSIVMPLCSQITRVMRRKLLTND